MAGTRVYAVQVQETCRAEGFDAKVQANRGFVWIRNARGRVVAEGFVTDAGALRLRFEELFRWVSSVDELRRALADLKGSEATDE